MSIRHDDLVLPLPEGWRTARFHRLGTAAPAPWIYRAGRHPRLVRLVTVPDGRIRRVELRPDRRGLVVRVTGAAAAEAEILVPVAARVRSAVPATADGVSLRGFTVYEELALRIVADACAADAQLLLTTLCRRLGRRASRYPGLRTFPEPAAVVAGGLAALRAAGLPADAARALLRLARCASRPRDPLALLADAPADATPPALRRRHALPARVAAGGTTAPTPAARRRIVRRSRPGVPAGPARPR